MAVLGLLALIAPFTDKNGPFTGWIAQTIGQIAGWGGIIIPLVMIIGGLTLLFRHYEHLPRISGGRVGGIFLIYLNILTWFHFFAGGGYQTARAAKGGGFIGAGFDTFFKDTLGPAGEVVVLIAWFLIALIFIIDVSLAELAGRVRRFFTRLSGRKSSPLVEAA